MGLVPIRHVVLLPWCMILRVAAALPIGRIRPTIAAVFVFVPFVVFARFLWFFFRHFPLASAETRTFMQLTWVKSIAPPAAVASQSKPSDKFSLPIGR